MVPFRALFLELVPLMGKSPFEPRLRNEILVTFLGVLLKILTSNHIFLMWESFPVRGGGGVVGEVDKGTSLCMIQLNLQ